MRQNVRVTLETCGICPCMGECCSETCYGKAKTEGFFCKKGSITTKHFHYFLSHSQLNLKALNGKN